MTALYVSGGFAASCALLALVLLGINDVRFDVAIRHLAGCAMIGLILEFVACAWTLHHF